MVKKSVKKILSMLIVFSMIFTGSIVSFAGGLDVENHWSKEYVVYLAEKGILEGYSDGTFRANNNITRAEFFTIINKLMKYTEKSAVNFSDVKEKSWYYDEVAKGISAGYITATEGSKLGPNEKITREEVAKIIGIAFGLDDKQSSSANDFADAESISNDVKGYVSILKDREILCGYSDNTFRPQSPITKGEASKIIVNTSGEIINVSGEYNKNYSGNVLINTPDVVLKTLNIKGNLYLTEGIGDGDVTLDNVAVNGETVIKGGGENSIKIKNSKLGQVVVDKTSGGIRVVLEGNVSIPNLVLNKDTKLVVKEGAKVENIQAVGKADIEVEKGAEIGKIEVNSKDVEIKSEGKIEKLVATEEVKVNNEVVKKGTETKVETKPSTDSSSSGSISTGGTSTGGGGYIPSPDPTPEEPKPTPTVNVTGVSICDPAGVVDKSTTIILVLDKYDSIQLYAKVEPSNATNKNVTWSTSNTDIATIDANGKVTAKASGTVIITVTTVDGNKIATCKVTVKANASKEEVEAALKAVNEAKTADEMKTAIEDNAKVLGLSIGEGTDYGKLVPGRDRSVSVDLVGNRPTEGYTLDQLKLAFDEIVATRVVFQNSVNMVNEATEENPLKDVKFITMLIENLSSVKNYTKHSGKDIKTELIPSLQSLVDRYDALDTEKQASALKKVSSADYQSSTQTRNALAKALTEQENASKEEVEAALKAVNEAKTADEMKTAIEKNARVLGLSIEENTDYGKLVPGRDRSVSVDLVGNRPTEGYTLDQLKLVFDEIVATRVVFQNSVNMVNEATEENPLKDVTFITMLINNLKDVKNYTKHSGIEISTLINDLQSLVDRYNALDIDKQASALKQVSSADYQSSTQTRNALAKALTEQENASKEEVEKALKAVNEVQTADEMKTAIEDNAKVLGLSIGEGTDYTSLLPGRDRSVSVDLVGNRPTEGYTLDQLKLVFDEIVATRVVFQNSVNMVNEATGEKPLKDVTFITMLINNLSSVKNYTKHSGIEISTLINDLQSLVDRYNALDTEKQASALKKVSSADYQSSTQTRNALDKALTEQENASKEEVEKALKAVNEVQTADEMKTAIEDNAKVLGLSIGEGTDYGKLVPGRDRSVSVDLVGNRQYEADSKYTLVRLREIFDDIVATRLVTQESMNLVNNAETAENLNGIEYVTILLNRFNKAGYTQHSSHKIKEKVIYLEGLVNGYNVLDDEAKEVVLRGVIEIRNGKTNGKFARSQETTDALETALTEVETKIEAALNEVNAADESQMKAIIADSNKVEILGLETGVGSGYNGLIEGRRPSVATDLYYNRPEGEGYNLAILQKYFNEIVETRHVTQESVDLVNNAKNNVKPLNGLEFVQILKDRFSNVSYKYHSRALITKKLEILDNILKAFNDLEDDNARNNILTQFLDEYTASTDTIIKIGQLLNVDTTGYKN